MSRSIAQGSALMRVAATVFTEIPSFKTMRDANIGSQIVRFHHAPVFGLICGLLGMDAEASQRGYLFITMRDVISVATRLNLVGPLGAAVLQHQVSVVAETILKKWADCPVEEACRRLLCLILCRASMAICSLDFSALDESHQNKMLLVSLVPDISVFIFFTRPDISVGLLL
ncbi:Urease accessory protein F [Linum perenne]